MQAVIGGKTEKKEPDFSESQINSFFFFFSSSFNRNLKLLGALQKQ